MSPAKLQLFRAASERWHPKCQFYIFPGVECQLFSSDHPLRVVSSVDHDFVYDADNDSSPWAAVRALFEMVDDVARITATAAL